MHDAGRSPGRRCSSPGGDLPTVIAGQDGQAGELRALSAIGNEENLDVGT